MLVSKKHKKLVVNSRNPTRITTVIPSAKIFEYKGRQLVSIPHKLDEVRVLRNMGIQAPSPIAYHYEWAGRYKPFKHQQVTAEFLTLNVRAFVLNQIGTGKTMSVLWAIDYLFATDNARKVLIVSPLSTLERVWADEIFRNFPHLTAVVLHGTAEKRRRLLSSPADIYIINHDGLKVLQKELLARPDIDVVVIDELAEYRNASTDRWKTLNSVVKDRMWVWGLTGSPTPKAPTDAWAQCRLLAPDKVPKFFGRFRDLVMRQVTTYKWEPRTDAKRVVHAAMQPAVIFTRDECLDLPPCTFSTRTVTMGPEAAAAYKDMVTKLKSEYLGGQITAVNDAVKAMKLVQIACIAYNTPVLTSAGWVPIQDITADMRVWDGEEWVIQQGAVAKGFRRVVDCGGVYMTEDHKVLSTEGWCTAEEMLYAATSRRFTWAPVRLPDCYPTGGNIGVKVRDVVVPVPVRQTGGAREPVSTQHEARLSAQLRVPSRQRDAQNDGVSCVQHLDTDAGTVPKSAQQRLPELRRARSNRFTRVAEIVRRFLGRHAGGVLGHTVFGSNRQCKGVLPRQLPVGDAGRAKQQQTQHRVCGDAAGGNASGPSSASVRPESRDTTGTPNALRLAAGESTAVYDLVDCGPRNRFVVRGVNGELRIVHNCGVAYTATGEDVIFPAESRVNEAKEIIQQAEGKVILYVPLTGGLNLIAAELRADGHRVGVVHGQTPKAERDVIFSEFQSPNGDIDVLVAHPQCMSHGLTLTSASVIIWYIPTNNFAVYEQACGRIVRQGQKRHQHIIHLEGSPVERRMYALLEKRDTAQSVLLELFREEQTAVN